MFILAWLLLGSGSYLSWSAVKNRNPLATLQAWLAGKPLPTAPWHPVPNIIAAINPGSAVGGAFQDGANAVSGSGMGKKPVYNLPGTPTYVQRAADVVGAMFGIKTIYGKGPGSVPGSDHPSGKALDFMTPSKSVGDGLAAYFVLHASTFNVKYIIWYHREWNPQVGWHAYTGSSNPHTDHVHVSFN